MQCHIYATLTSTSPLLYCDSEMGTSFSRCGKYLVVCVSTDTPSEECQTWVKQQEQQEQQKQKQDSNSSSRQSMATESTDSSVKQTTLATSKDRLNPTSCPSSAADLHTAATFTATPATLSGDAPTILAGLSNLPSYSSYNYSTYDEQSQQSNSAGTNTIEHSLQSRRASLDVLMSEQSDAQHTDEFLPPLNQSSVLPSTSTQAHHSLSQLQSLHPDLASLDLASQPVPIESGHTGNGRIPHTTASALEAWFGSGSQILRSDPCSQLVLSDTRHTQEHHTQQLQQRQQQQQESESCSPSSSIPHLQYSTAHDTTDSMQVDSIPSALATNRERSCTLPNCDMDKAEGTKTPSNPFCLSSTCNNNSITHLSAQEQAASVCAGVDGQNAEEAPSPRPQQHHHRHGRHHSNPSSQHQLANAQAGQPRVPSSSSPQLQATASQQQQQLDATPNTTRIEALDATLTSPHQELPSLHQQPHAQQEQQPSTQQRQQQQQRPQTSMPASSPQQTNQQSRSQQQAQAQPQQHTRPQGTYELRIYELDGQGRGRLAVARPIQAAHCMTSLQFSPSSGHLLVAYGRRHISLCSMVVDKGCMLPVHSILEVYRCVGMMWWACKHAQGLRQECSQSVQYGLWSLLNMGRHCSLQSLHVSRCCAEFGKSLPQSGISDLVQLVCVTSEHACVSGCVSCLVRCLSHISNHRSTGSADQVLQPTSHLHCCFFRVSDLSLVRVLLSMEDEVNVACWGPLASGGIVYGTKEGRLRVLRHDR